MPQNFIRTGLNYLRSSFNYEDQFSRIRYTIINLFPQQKAEIGTSMLCHHLREEIVQVRDDRSLPIVAWRLNLEFYEPRAGRISSTQYPTSCHACVPR